MNRDLQMEEVWQGGQGRSPAKTLMRERREADGAHLLRRDDCETGREQGNRINEKKQM